MGFGGVLNMEYELIARIGVTISLGKPKPTSVKLEVGSGTG